MDIDSLSRLIGKVLREHESATLPGLGSFESQLAPATFSDKGYTINPPYRKVVFRERVESDNYLVQYYAAEKSITEDEAARVIGGFLKALGVELTRRPHILLPGLGRLKSIKDGGIMFIADEDADIFPDGFGLEPVSLKSRMVEDAEPIEYVSPEELYPIVQRPAEPEPEPVPEPVEEETVPEPVEAPEPEPEPVPEPVEEETVPEPVEEPVVVEPEPEPVAEPVEAPEPEPEPETAPEPVETVPEPVEGPAPRKRSALKTTLLVVLWLAAFVALALAVFMLLADVAPDFIDSLLYSKEELEILNS